MDGTTIGIGVAVGALGLGVIWSFFSKKSVGEIFSPGKDNMNKKYEIGEVGVEEQKVSEEREKAPSSKKNVKELGKKLMNLFKSSSYMMILSGSLMLGNPDAFAQGESTDKPMTCAEKCTKVIEKMKVATGEYIQMTERYVDATEKEFNNLRDNTREDTKYRSYAIDNGKRIKLHITIPIKQPYVDAKGNVTQVVSPPIRRKIVLTPDIKTDSDYKSGLHLFTGMLLGAHYDLNTNTMQPGVGFEVLNFYTGPLSISFFPMFTTTAWGFGTGVGPSRRVNMKAYVAGGRLYEGDSFTFMAGVSAIINW